MTNRTLSTCQTDAVTLAALIEGIDLMGNEGAAFDNARIAATTVALRMASQLAADLDKIDTAMGETKGPEEVS